MKIFLNGQLVPERQAVVSVFDRSFLYGDGLFETVAIHRAHPFRWRQHLDRLQRGADYLRLPLPFAPEALRQGMDDLIVANRMPEGLLRLTLSRGVGRRGYSPKGAEEPCLVMALHPTGAVETAAPPAWRLKLASPRLLSGDPLARFKTCNKLPQVLARAEADAAQADEALLLNTDGRVVEGAGSNLFWIEEGAVCTPAIGSGILPGVTREVVCELCVGLGLPVREASPGLPELLQAQGVFLSLTSLGVVEGVSLEGRPLSRSPLVETLREAYARIFDEESVMPGPAPTAARRLALES